jgi:hypothetical protein
MQGEIGFLVIHLGTAALGCPIERNSMPSTCDSEANSALGSEANLDFGWRSASALRRRCKVKAALSGGERPAVNSSASHLDEFSFAASVVREDSSLTAFFGAGFFAASARFRS